MMDIDVKAFRPLIYFAVAVAFAALPACSGGSLLNVTPVPLALSLSGSAPAVGKTSQLNAIAQMSDGSSQTVTSQASGWTSSDANVATVSSTGLVTGVASGTFTVTATYQGFTAVTPLLTVP